MRFYSTGMRFLIALLFTAALISFPHPALQAQVLNSDNLRNIDISRLSDDDISAYYQKAKSSGFSDEQLLALAIQRGLPENQATLLKERIDKIKMTGSVQGTQASDKSKAQPVSGKSPSGTAAGPAVTPLARDYSIFGADIFSEASTVFEPNYKIATPAGYVLGPGDELMVQVFGYSEQTYNLTVSDEGSVFITGVGPISVSGFAMDAATAKIKSRLASTIYRAISSGQTKVQVSLSKIRNISVSVIGQASRPGTYSVSSLTTLFNLLYLCGGPSDMGSFRNIELIRGSQVYKNIDLYSFLLRGDRKDNVMLQDQDVVRIPYYGSRVLLEGAVRRPGKFEMQTGEKLEHLLSFSGGFSDSAFRGSVKMTRITDTGRVLADVRAEQFSLFTPQSGDSYQVSKALNKYNNRIAIKGAVYRPGDFELKAGMTIQELIREAGGLKPDAYLERGIIARLNSDLSPASVWFNVSEAVSGARQIALQNEDIVTIPSLFDLKDARTIDVQGLVRMPGKMIYRENLTVKDALLLAGGFAEGADQRFVELARINENPEVSADLYLQSNVIRIPLNNGLVSAEANTVLKPYDLIIVRGRGNFELQRSVILSGQVNSPGKYALEKSKETISDLLKRGGGFKGSADSSSVSIRRFANFGLPSEERQAALQRLLNINQDSLMADPMLRKKFLNDFDFLSVNMEKVKSNPGGPEDLILEDGDYIEVSRASSLVRVSGEVFHPTLLPYERNKNAKYYIERSGNFTSNSRRAKTFVVYPDGRSISVKRFLWFKKFPDITPRSEVFVPSRDMEGKKPMSPGELIAMSSIIATAATLAVTLINALK